MDYYDFKGNTKKAGEAGKKAELLLPYITNEDFITLYYLLRATQLLNKGEYKEALRHIDISIERHPSKDSPLYLLLFKKVIKSEILAKLGELEKALDLAENSYKGLKKIYPNELHYKVLRTEIGIAFIYLKQGKLDDSLHLITSVIGGLSKFYKTPYESSLQPFPHVILGEIYEKRNDLLKALEEYKKAEEVYAHIFKTVEVDDISYLYKNLAVLGEKMKDEYTIKKYLHLLTDHFGLDHPKTIETIKYLDDHGYSAL
ncbi:MAG: tetratricopeptide repeat protein [Thermodesulfobium sp.]